MSKVIKVRHDITGDTRRLVLSEWPDLFQLHTALVGSFQTELPSPYSLKYTDSDGDLISITSNAELHEAIMSARGGMLSLVLGLAPQRSTSVAVLPSPSSPAPSTPSVARLPSYAVSISGTPYLQSGALPSVTPPSMYADVSVTASQSPDTLFIDTSAPQFFIVNLLRLLSAGYGWEQTRDVLIDFGGDYDKALAELKSGPPRRVSTPTTRYYFSLSFTRSVNQLLAAGFEQREIVAALIRNAGVLQNAALELASLGSGERCPQGHVLEVSSYNLGDYATQWYCDRCRKRDQPGQRWFCMSCKYDVCFGCKPAPIARVPEVLKPEPAPAPVVSDLSLPPSLLEPVRLLEAMGFIDRMRIIEALVKNSGDVVRCATELAEERRKAEEAQAAFERQQARAARQAAARKAREEAAARAAEERRLEEQRRQEQIRLHELESKRRDAAKIVVQNPEQIGSNLAYLMGMGFDCVSSTSSLFNAGGDLQAALDDLLQNNKQ